MKRKRTSKIQEESEGRNRKKKRMGNKGRNTHCGSSASGSTIQTDHVN